MSTTTPHDERLSLKIFCLQSELMYKMLFKLFLKVLMDKTKARKEMLIFQAYMYSIHCVNMRGISIAIYLQYIYPYSFHMCTCWMVMERRHIIKKLLGFIPYQLACLRALRIWTWTWSDSVSNVNWRERTARASICPQSSPTPFSTRVRAYCTTDHAFPFHEGKVQLKWQTW